MEMEMEMVFCRHRQDRSRRGRRGRLPISTRSILTFRCGFSARMTLVPQLGRFLIYQQGPREENGVFGLAKQAGRIESNRLRRNPEEGFPFPRGWAFPRRFFQPDLAPSDLPASYYSRAWSHFTKTRFPRRKGFLGGGGGKGYCIVSLRSMEYSVRST